MPTSTLDDFLEQYQQRILRHDRHTASVLVRTYLQSWKRVKSRLEKLQAEYTESIKRGEDVSLNWIYQNSRLADLQELIARELGKFGKIAGDKITQEQRRAIEESLEFSRDAMILRLGPEYDVPGGLRVRSLNTAAIEQMVGVNQPGSPLWKLLESISAQGAQKASDALIEGMVLGYNPRKIAPMVRDALGVQLNRALTISRTEVMRAHRAATDANYNANADVVKGWRWQAALMGNTCPLCVSMHGREFPLSEKMTSHPNCRCVAQPLTYSWEELGERFGVDWSRVEDAGPSFEEIAKKYGISPERMKTYRDRQMTGEAYFNTLKPDKQRALLGPTRYNAWKDGAVDFEALSKQTFSLEWGAGKALTPLTELLTPEQIALYKK